MPGRVAFVPLRYGEQIVGGSEALTREIAMGLAGRGWDVEVLTTRVVDHQSMADELPAGVTHRDGLTLRRFSTDHHWSLPGRQAQWQIQDGVMPPLDVQWTWVSWRFSIPDLYTHLIRYGSDYDAVVFSPYMFWNTTACIGARPERTVVMPCLHDESYARLAVMRPVLSDPVSVWFLSEPEHQLAHRLGPVAEHHSVTGAGLHVPDSYDPARFRARHGLERPFILYAGRREADKGWGWLLDQYHGAVAAGLDGVDLVTFGSGAVEADPSRPGRLVDLGFVSEEDRNDAFAAASLYVQPSRMESFSRTVMEAWLAGTPVLAVEGSEVVAWHCDRSGGGATFADAASLAEVAGRIISDPAEAKDMGRRGRDYVIREYSWPVVLDRIEADLDHVRSRLPTPAPAAATAGTGATPGAEGTAATTGPVLVVGSYPPIPVAGAAVAAAEVRRAWSWGGPVVVAAPRLSAAALTVPVHGLLAGRRLVNLRRVTGARRLVLVAEAGYPLRGSAARQYAAALILARAMKDFEHVRLVRAGRLGWSSSVEKVLFAAADEMVTAPAGESTLGVTVLGPAEVAWQQRFRRIAGRLAGRLLGSRAPAVKAAAGRVRRAAGGPLRRPR